MCLIIWVNEDRYQQERSRIREKYRRRYPRLASMFCGQQGPPPQYDEEAGPPQRQINPFAKRPDSLKLPAYKGHRKPPQATAGHTVMEVKDSEKAVA